MAFSIFFRLSLNIDRQTPLDPKPVFFHDFPIDSQKGLMYACKNWFCQMQSHVYGPLLKAIPRFGLRTSCISFRDPGIVVSTQREKQSSLRQKGSRDLGVAMKNQAHPQALQSRADSSRC